MRDQKPLVALFQEFRDILEEYGSQCVVSEDSATEYYLNAKKIDRNGKPVFFAGASINKISVSFYLMPVFDFPDLLDDISDELRSCLQGKCCFRFKKDETKLLEELARLTKNGFERYQNLA